MREGTFLEKHPVKLSKPEVHERAVEGSKISGEIKALKRAIETHKEDTKAATKRMELDEEALTARLFELGRVVRTETEPREVECEERGNMANFMVETTRIDTGEIVGSRPMTKVEIEDRQLKIAIPEKPAKKKTPAGAN